MIQFEKTNQKGEKLMVFTHRGYLSSHYSSEICKAERNAQKKAELIGYGTTILTYWALNNVPIMTNFIKAKLPWKGAFLLASFFLGQLVSFGTSIIFTSIIRRRQENLLKNELFPAWFNKEQVINPERLFFQLDDNNNYEPNVLHSAITASAIKRLVPDIIMGNPHKPHLPVAEQHHH